MPWLSYLPIPGVGIIAVWTAPEDPHVRFHAWQGSVLVLAAYVVLIVLGLLGRISDAGWYAATIGLLAGVWFLAVIVGLVWGIVAAARGRYDRIRPVWDVLSALRR